MKKRRAGRERGRKGAQGDKKRASIQEGRKRRVRTEHQRKSTGGKPQIASRNGHRERRGERERAPDSDCARKEGKKRNYPKGKIPQRLPGVAGGRGARNSGEPPMENRPLERRETQKQAEEENRRRTAGRTGARQTKLEKTQRRPHQAATEVGYKSPREDPEE